MKNMTLPMSSPAASHVSVSAQVGARSYLFVPGNRPERFDKACASGADVVIIDLEDAVPEADKVVARAQVVAWLSLAHPAHPVLIRINGATTCWFDGDLALCALPGVAGIVLSKAQSVNDILRVARAGAVAIFPLIESAIGFAQALVIAQAPLVQRLLFGTIDFKLDLGIDGEREELLYFRSQLVLLSRIAGIGSPVDGVSTAIGEAHGLIDDTLHARRMGFGAKLCIHPAQLVHVHACFRPSADDVAWAMRVLAAAGEAEADYAASVLDGQMIDRPLLLRAQRIVLASAEAAEAAEIAEGEQATL